MKLFHAIYTEEDCTSLQQDLILSEHWTNKSLLKFHPNKCSHVRIGLSSIRNDGYTLGPEHITITSTDKVKDIGVTFDSSLNFEAQMSEKINKANSLMGIIRRTFDHIDEQCFSTFLKSLIRPHIEYANQIWSPHLKKHITSFENVQRRATKLIPGFKDIEYKERTRGDMIEVYKLLHGKYDSDVCNIIKLHKDSNTREGTRGHSLKLFIERACTNVRKESFSLSVTRLWNDLPEVVVTVPSVNSFKNRLDRHWSTEEFLYNYKAALPGSRRAFQGKVRDLTTEATAYGQEEPK